MTKVKFILGDKELNPEDFSKQKYKYTKQNLSLDIKQNLSLDTKQNLSLDIKQNLSLDTKQNINKYNDNYEVLCYNNKVFEKINLLFNNFCLIFN